MTIVTARIYYYPRSKRRERKLTQTHWGFSTWFARRLAPIREQLRGPEAKGVDIVNFMLHESPEYVAWPSQWFQLGNTFEFNFLCDLRPLELAEPIENIEKLMRFTGHVASAAPWPQVRAVGEALLQPLSQDDRSSLLPYLQWPREERFMP